MPICHPGGEVERETRPHIPLQAHSALETRPASRLILRYTRLVSMAWAQGCYDESDDYRALPRYWQADEPYDHPREI